MSACLPRSEVRRKALHMLPGIAPFAFALIPHRDPLSPTALAIVTLTAIVLTAWVLAARRIIQRADDANWTARVLSYPAVVMALVWTFPQHPEYAAVACVVLAMGDGMATLEGLCWGRKGLPWNSRKSWAGLAAFVGCAGPLAVAVYWLEAQPKVPVAEAACFGLTATLAGAVAETLPTRINDNLRVGVAAAAALLSVDWAWNGSL